MARSLSLLQCLVLLAAVSLTGTSTTVTVTAVVGKCSLGTGAMAFGSYDPIVANATTPFDSALNGITGSITISCTKGTASPTPAVQLSLGSNAAHASGSCKTGTCTRAMSDGAGDYLSYDLYTSAAENTVWNTSNTVAYSSTSFAPATLTIYGYIPAAQNVSISANYSDSILATVNY